jgi:hypothetical protein
MEPVKIEKELVAGYVVVTAWDWLPDKKGQAKYVKLPTPYSCYKQGMKADDATRQYWATYGLAAPQDE